MSARIFRLPLILRSLCVLTCCVFVANLFAAPITPTTQTPLTQATPGGIVKVPLGSYAARPTAYHKKNQLLVLQEEQTWYALVGLPLKTKLGTHKITVKHRNKREVRQFRIHNHPYQEQRIRLKNRNFVTPNKQTQKRIRKDWQLTKGVYKDWLESYQPLTQIPFLPPLESGILTGAFGTKRYFNDQPRNPHSGIDIAADKGTPIYAVADGLVTLAKDLFFNGNAVFINHGFGIISMYFHLDSISVREDQVIMRGDVVGTVGSTGRSTGPHLHFGISMNNARVNPELFYTKNQLQALYTPSSPKN